MRFIHREELARPLTEALFRRQIQAAATGDVAKEWENFRKTVAGNAVAERLAFMAGTRARCYYCSDSRGTDIEHFKPIVGYSEEAFKWKNFLYVCTGCNRYKSNKFPVDSLGKPLLINPTWCDPWRFLFLDTATGVVVERDLGGTLDPRAVETLKIIKTLSTEAAEEGRSRVIRRLAYAAEEVLAGSNEAKVCQRLAREVADDDFGISRWFAIWDGADEAPFSLIRTGNHSVWRSFVRWSTRRY
ncbi:hypothetical protein [Actinoplanes lobatus]|uniref:HNH endonuclease n=1 Tax=Actinoplanes lobatus TaxID=113568 RepID=A0A7W7HR74_9ACTN|nr:hypothetical protein [Actinoplanes lobatus]MBB4755180.1 hypothetical protein [Actinoplanes lobatus]